MKGVKVVTDKTQALLSTLGTLSKMQLLVGIPEDKDARQDGDGLGNAAIGYIQNYGSPVNNIPPSPFLEPGVDAVADRCADIIAKGLGDAMAGGGGAALEKAYNKAGLLAQASIRSVITKQEGFDPLSESTIEAREREGFKGKKRLIRTGQLRNSITYVVRKRG